MTVRSPTPDLDRFGFLASVVAGRAVGVALAEPGRASFTDGRTIFIDRRQVDDARVAVVVQASLLAVGSLDASALRAVHRTPRARRRYLGLEVARAVSQLAQILPEDLLADVPVAISHSALASAKLANGRDHLPAPDPRWGKLPRSPVAAHPAAHLTSVSPGETPPTSESDEGEDDEEAGPGRLRRLLARLTGNQQVTADTRKKKRRSRPDATTAETGPLDGVPTYMRSGRPPETGSRVVAASSRGISGVRAHDLTKTATYPEWDAAGGTYREGWVTVFESLGVQGTERTVELPPAPSVRRQLAALHLDLEHARRQHEGDHLDLDALVASRLDRATGGSPSPNVYVATRRLRRDLGVGILVDLSGSTAKRARGARTILDVQLAAAGTLIQTFEGLGDRAACFGFRSFGRRRVEITRVKSFDERFDATVRARMSQLASSGFTRLGAAIRHSTRIVRAESGTRRWLLIVCSDGFPFDDGYEADYAEADTRRALDEVRGAGVGCLCLSLGGAPDDDRLRRVFGGMAYARADQLGDLSDDLGALVGTALASADRRRATTTSI